MYIAHHLLTLGHQFRPKLPEPLNQSVASFVDLVPTIRHMGEKCFLEQLVSISNLISQSVWNILAHVASDCLVNTSTNMTYLFILQRKQKSNLLEILKATKGFANADEDEKGLQVERTMKQVRRTLWLLTKQLLHLCSRWNSKFWQVLKFYSALSHPLKQTWAMLSFLPIWVNFQGTIDFHRSAVATELHTFNFLKSTQNQAILFTSLHQWLRIC